MLGTQFVILDLPAGAPTQGSFSFNFSFAMPAGTAPVPTGNRWSLLALAVLLGAAASLRRRARHPW